MKKNQVAPPSAGQASALVPEPEAAALVAELQKLLDEVWESWRLSEQHNHDWGVASTEDEEDRKESYDCQPTKEEGKIAEVHAEHCRRASQSYNVRDRLMRAGEGLPKSATQLTKAHRRLQDALTRITNKHPRPSLPAPLLAIVIASEQVLGTLEGKGTDLYEAAAERQHLVPGRHREPPANTAQLLSKAHDELMALYRGYTAAESLRVAVRNAEQVLQALDREEFVEPKRPTVEEVARYLQMLETWAAKYLDAQRLASQELDKFVRELAKFEKLLEAAIKAHGRTIFLLSRELPPESAGQIEAAGKLLQHFEREQRGWRYQVENWQQAAFDKSAPGPRTRSEDDEYTLALRESHKTAGFGVAFKNAAQAHLKDMETKTTTETPSRPSLPHPNLDKTNDVDEYVAAMAKHQSEFDAVVQANRRINAQKEVAQDAYMARKTKMHEAGDQCQELADKILPLVSARSSEELRILLIRATKLHKLHGPDPLEVLGNVAGGNFNNF